MKARAVLVYADGRTALVDGCPGGSVWHRDDGWFRGVGFAHRRIVAAEGVPEVLVYIERPEPAT